MRYEEDDRAQRDPQTPKLITYNIVGKIFSVNIIENTIDGLIRRQKKKSYGSKFTFRHV